MQAITVEQFNDVVVNIIVSRYLGFNEVELTIEGHNHNKALHISIACADTLVSRVLVDTCSSLNILMKRTLSHLQFEGPEMRASSLIVRAFDGSRREVIGEVNFPVCVCPHQFTITFQVMDIHPTYNFLLGRPWIHDAGAVTPTLHLKLKFMFRDKLVIVCGEEDFVISELSSFWHVEIEEEISEVPFHYLDFEDVNYSSVNQSQSADVVLSSTISVRRLLRGALSPVGSKLWK